MCVCMCVLGGGLCDVSRDQTLFQGFPQRWPQRRSWQAPVSPGEDAGKGGGYSGAAAVRDYNWYWSSQMEARLDDSRLGGQHASWEACWEK